MPTPKPPYSAAFRQQIVVLVRAGRGPSELAREFGSNASSIHAWVNAAKVDDGVVVHDEAQPLNANERQELIGIAPPAAPGSAGARHPGKGYGLVCRQEREDVRHVYELVKANQADFPLRTLCRVLRVSTSGYCDWRDRAPSSRAQANAALAQRISEVHRASDATYGMPRVHAELADQGALAGRNRIARLMRLHRLRGVSRRRGWCVTTRRDKSSRPAPGLVQRQFSAAGLNQLWVPT